jgi:hypothetical protein
VTSVRGSPHRDASTCSSNRKLAEGYERFTNRPRAAGKEHKLMYIRFVADRKTWRGFAARVSPNLNAPVDRQGLPQGLGSLAFCVCFLCVLGKGEAEVLGEWRC